MNQAPRWLPYRLRKAVDQCRVNHALRGLDRVGPVIADDAQIAHAEVFMLVCKRDLKLSALALKSLLHQRGDTKLAVTAVDDGSLSAADRQWLDRHVPNVRWQTNRSEEVLASAVMKGMPHVSKLYRDSSFPLMSKIVHPFLFHRTRRVVLLDSDTAFFSSPTRLLDYCAGRMNSPLYMHDHQDESKVIPAETAPAFEALTETLALPSGRFRLKHWLFNSGLLAFRPDDLNLNLAERFLAWLSEAPPETMAGKMSIWFGPWTREQTIYMLMFASGPIEAMPLGDDYWLGGARDRVFNHFLRFYLVRKGCLDMLRGLIERLATEIR